MKNFTSDRIVCRTDISVSDVSNIAFKFKSNNLRRLFAKVETSFHCLSLKRDLY